MRLGLAWAAVLGVVSGIAAMARPISVAEINYNPLDGSDYEFIELINPGATPFVLTGCQFTAGIDYVFGALTLPAGGRVVVARDLGKFASRYPGVTALGPYKKKLSDTGDTVVFNSAVGAELFRVKYDSSGAWPSRANGLGSSLEVLDPNGDLNDPLNWRSSAEYQGSPGRAGIGGLRTVVINEVLPHTDPPFEDAIEFKNLTDQPIKIGGGYLSNSRAAPLNYRLPRTLIVPAHGYAVVYERSFNSASQGAEAFTFNSAHGDEAVLLAADAAGNPTLWLDAVSFDASANGVSFGRYPDGTGPLITLARQTFGTDLTAAFPPEFLSEFILGKGASNAGPLVGPVVFNRIQYQPLAGQEEYLELKNITGLTVPLYDPAYPTNAWRLGDGVGFTFPTGHQLGAGETAWVVRTNPAAFRLKYGISEEVQIFGPFTNALSNAGERLELFRPDATQGPQHPDFGFVPYILVDQVDYKPTAPWPEAAAGTGAYLERINPAGYGNDPANWRAATTTQAPVLLQAERLANGRLRLTVIGARLAPLRLESSPAVGGPVWALVATLPAGSGNWVQEVPLTDAAAFYRVR